MILLKSESHFGDPYQVETFSDIAPGAATVAGANSLRMSMKIRMPKKPGFF